MNFCARNTPMKNSALLMCVFDNYEDVTKGMGESTRANISGEVNEVLSNGPKRNGFILANNKESFLVGINQASLQDLWKRSSQFWIRYMKYR